MEAKGPEENVGVHHADPGLLQFEGPNAWARAQEYMENLRNAPMVNADGAFNVEWFLLHQMTHVVEVPFDKSPGGHWVKQLYNCHRSGKARVRKQEAAAESIGGAVGVAASAVPRKERGSKKVGCAASLSVYTRLPQRLAEREVAHTTQVLEEDDEALLLHSTLVYVKRHHAHTGHESGPEEYKLMSLKSKTRIFEELSNVSSYVETPKALKDWKQEEMEYFWTQWAQEFPGSPYPARYYQLLSLSDKDYQNIMATARQAKGPLRGGRMHQDDAQAALMLIEEMRRVEAASGRGDPFLYVKLGGLPADIPEYATSPEAKGRSCMLSWKKCEGEWGGGQACLHLGDGLCLQLVGDGLKAVCNPH